MPTGRWRVKRRRGNGDGDECGQRHRTERWSDHDQRDAFGEHRGDPGAGEREVRGREQHPHHQRGRDGSCETDDSPVNAFVQGGNAFGATAVLGTTDNNALDIRVNNARVMRYESTRSVRTYQRPSAELGRRRRPGATIGGGGAGISDTDPDFSFESPNVVTDVYGTVSGGFGNQAGDNGFPVTTPFASVGGGISNTAGGYASIVAGGFNNTASACDSTSRRHHQFREWLSEHGPGGGFNTASGIYSLAWENNRKHEARQRCARPPGQDPSSVRAMRMAHSSGRTATTLIRDLRGNPLHRTGDGGRAISSWQSTVPVRRPNPSSSTRSATRR